MARQYGTKLGGAWAGIGAIASFAALSAGAGAQPAGPESLPRATDSTNLWHDPVGCTMDEWDERLIDLLAYICMFFKCGSSPQMHAPNTDLQAEVEWFIARCRGATVPPDSAQSDVADVHAAIEDARWINATQPLLPSWLAADLDTVLAGLEMEIRAVTGDPEGAVH